MVASGWIIGLGFFLLIAGIIMIITAVLWKTRSVAKVWTGGMTALLVIGIISFVIGFILLPYAFYVYSRDFTPDIPVVVVPEVIPSVTELPPPIVKNKRTLSNLSQADLIKLKRTNAQLEAMKAIDRENLYLKSQRGTFNNLNEADLIKLKRTNAQLNAMNAIDRENLYLRSQVR